MICAKAIRSLTFVTVLVWSSVPRAEAPDYSGFAGPLVFLWAISHPISTIQALSQIPADRRRRELLSLAWKQCEAEIKLIPSSFEIDAFVDEGAALHSTLMLELLINRKLRAIYVKPFRVVDSNTYNLSGFWNISGEKIPQPLGAIFAKIELAKEGQAQCVPKQDLPIELRHRVGRVPLLPDTCIALSFTDKPQASHALKYFATNTVYGEQFGIWSMVSLDDGKPIASLTVFDSLSVPLFGSPTDCRAPYSVLAWRIKPTVTSEKTLIVDEIEVRPNLPLSQIQSKFGPISSVEPKVTKSPYSAADNKLLFKTEIYDEGWKTAVDEAKKTGWGHYGSRLLDWKRMSLKKLNIAEPGGFSSNWKVASGGSGFFVFPADWRANNRKLLARYDASGNFEWAIEVSAILNECTLAPLRVDTTPTSIFLRSPNCEKTDGTNWEIIKNDIPFYSAKNTKSSIVSQTSETKSVKKKAKAEMTKN